MPPYRKLLAATCRQCENLTDATSLIRASNTWSGFAYLCRPCARERDRKYNKTPAGRARWQRRQTGANREPHRRYRDAHLRIEKERGKAADHTCYCGAPAASWSLLPMVPHLKDGPFAYSPDPADYTPMCKPHHSLWDGQFRRLKGA
ncbi:hypothetical protein GCM10022233_26010 [Streptomyces shaanxiensis]|uniref:HNH endonuclease n=1 Tax=Streptomyces shaanxiensis TaxID=653357 RepID=A0ABP7UX56_9ACTN